MSATTWVGATYFLCTLDNTPIVPDWVPLAWDDSRHWRIKSDGKKSKKYKDDIHPISICQLLMAFKFSTRVPGFGTFLYNYLTDFIFCWFFSIFHPSVEEPFGDISGRP